MSEKISILLQTSENRGDHAADVAIALIHVEGESVEDLLIRARAGGSDHIEIRWAADKR